MQGVKDLGDVTSFGFDKLSEPTSFIFIAHAPQLRQCLLNELARNLIRRLRLQPKREIKDTAAGRTIETILSSPLILNLDDIVQEPEINFGYVSVRVATVLQYSHCESVWLTGVKEESYDIILNFGPQTGSRCYNYCTRVLACTSAVAADEPASPLEGGGALGVFSPSLTTSTSTFTPNGSKKLDTACPTP